VRAKRDSLVPVEFGRSLKGRAPANDRSLPLRAAALACLRGFFLINDAPLALRGRPEAIARAMRPREIERGHAVVIGNRAGVVEWADDAWRKLTGFPLSETVGKPISHFLTATELPSDMTAELVEFVGQHYLAGRSCAVEFPFSNFDGRQIEVHLDVEPIKDDRGEVSSFLAVVREVTEAGSQQAGALLSKESIDRADDADTERSNAGIDLAANTEAAIAQWIQERPEQARMNWTLDVALDRRTPGIIADPERFEGLLHAMISATGILRDTDTMGTRVVSISTGSTTPRRSQHSPVHPIPARRVAQRDVPGVWIEVHDTGAHLSRDAIARIEGGLRGRTPRESDWLKASRIASAAGASIYFDSTPGCGNQALVVFDVAD